MDVIDDLEKMAFEATYEQPEDEGYLSIDLSKGTMKMLQEEFDFTYGRAAELVEMAKTAHHPSAGNEAAKLIPLQARTIHILKFNGPLETSIKVQKAAGLSKAPNIVRGESEDGKHYFCKVEGADRLAIETWLFEQKNNKNFLFWFIPEGMAHKKLSSVSSFRHSEKTRLFHTTAPHLVKENVEWYPKPRPFPAFATR